MYHLQVFPSDPLLKFSARPGGNCDGYSFAPGVRDTRINISLKLIVCRAKSPETQTSPCFVLSLQIPRVRIESFTGLHHQGWTSFCLFAARSRTTSHSLSPSLDHYDDCRLSPPL